MVQNLKIALVKLLGSSKFFVWRLSEESSEWNTQEKEQLFIGKGPSFSCALHFDNSSWQVWDEKLRR